MCQPSVPLAQVQTSCISHWQWPGCVGPSPWQPGQYHVLFWHTLGRVPYSSWVMSARGSGFLLKTSTPVNWSTELYPQWPAEKATEVNIALGQIPSWNPRTVESCQGRGNRSPQPASVYNRVMPFTTASLCPEYLFYCPCREIFPFGKNHQMVSVMLTTVH